jgi:hypothetical protein
MIVIVLYLQGKLTEPVKAVVYVTGVLIFLTISLNVRTYQSSQFNERYEMAKCKIVDNDYQTSRIKTPDGEYIVNKSIIVTYKAPDKKSEVLELHGQRRLYSYPVPDIVYWMYYLSPKETSTEIVIDRVNISKY